MTNHTTRAAFYRDYMLLTLEHRAVEPAAPNHNRLITRSKLIMAIKSRPRVVAELMVGISGVSVGLHGNTLAAGETDRLAKWIHFWLVETVGESDWWHLPDRTPDKSATEAG